MPSPIPTPIPTPTPSPALLLVTEPAWVWSLDSLIAVAGAVATILVACLALNQTRRANRLDGEHRKREAGERAEAREAEEQAQMRAQRAEMYAAIVRYAERWKPSGDAGPTEAHDAAQALIERAAAISDDALRVAAWATEALSAADLAAIEYQERHDNDLNPPADRSHLLRGAVSGLRYRAINWMSTGTLDTAPLGDYLYKRDRLEPPANRA